MVRILERPSYQQRAANTFRDLYILALTALQEKNESYKLSYFQLLGKWPSLIVGSLLALTPTRWLIYILRHPWVALYFVGRS